MEANVSGFTFFSTFDSGNLASVEAVPSELHPLHGLPELEAEEMPAEKGGPLSPTDYSFRMWTRPDCAGTEFENGNRTWLYFGYRGGPVVSDDESLPTLRFTVMNMNKQSKLFSQGMSPIALVVPLPHTIHAFGKDKNGLRHAYPQQWERIRDKPTYWTINGEKTAEISAKSNNFVLSFRVKCDPKATTYIAFTYPYSYKELQMYLSRLDRKYGNDASFENIETIDEKQEPSKVYFHRELAVRSLLNFRVDLLTITDSNGMTAEREAVLENLFPDYPHSLRAREFKGKKIIFLSARVHPGETQSSFVLNGFLKFLLRDNDVRAEALRRKYVFKLIPMLNPDGVVHGHYRTDSRGVNLNRVYSSPTFKLHPTIYAARKLFLYAHHRKEIFEDENKKQDLTTSNGEEEESKTDETTTCDTPTPEMLPKIDFKANDTSSSPAGAAAAEHWLRSCIKEPSSSTVLSPFVEPPIKSTTGWYEMTETSRFSEGDESIADFSVFNDSSKGKQPTPVKSDAVTSFVGAFGAVSNSTNSFAPVSTSSPRRQLIFDPEQRPSLAESSNGSSTMGEVPKEENANLEFPVPVEPPKETKDPVSDDDKNKVVLSKNSGIFMYVDIHGHASKRGIFMYGNHFGEMEHQVGCMLLPKLTSINCAHFDFPACVFTERNMYLKDRHTGCGKEGSGRVAAFKATGLLYSYTLEANFNTGRLVNNLPMASRDCGRATPPPKFDHPPKYDPDLYEDSGKALAIAMLDLTESNPWTRLTCSAYKNLRGVRDWLRKYIKAKAEEEAELAAKQSPNKKSAKSVRSTARRVRTFSASSVTGSKKKLFVATPKSPESYRPVSKLPRKNSGTLVPTNSPIRGRKLLPTTTSNTPTRSVSTSGVKRRPSSSSASSMRGRSQSVVVNNPMLVRTAPSTPSREGRPRASSPTSKRPPSRGGSGPPNKTPSKKKKSRSKSARKASSSNGNFQVTASSEVILPPVSSPFKKKKLKRIRRPFKGSQPDDQN